MSPDIRCVMGGQDPRYGIARIHDEMVVRRGGHDRLASLEATDMVVIKVMLRIRRVADRVPLALSCSGIYRFGQGVIQNWRVSADLAAIGPGQEGRNGGVGI